MKHRFHAHTCAGDSTRPRAHGALRRVALLVVVLESLGALPVTGTAVADDYTSLSLEQLMAIPVYSAAKREQKTSEAPSSVTVITSQDVRAYGWRTMSDLLRGVPGMWVSYTRSYGGVGVRGFERSGDFGGRILLLIDGHRMNDPLYDSAAIVEDFILDLDLIDRVEIVRGPGSALYGTNAFFAVVNVFTRRAPQVNGFEAAVEAGSQNAYRGRATFGATGENGTELLLSASRYKSDGKEDIYMPRLVVTEEPGIFDGHLHNGDAESSSRLAASARRGNWTLEGFYVSRDKDSPPAYETVPFLPRHTLDARAFVEGSYTHALPKDASVKVRLYYDWYKYVGTYLYGLDASNTPPFLTNKDFSLSGSVGGEAQVNLHPGAGHSATAGVEYRDNFKQVMQNYDVDPFASVLDINPATGIWSMYVQDEYRPSSHLGLTAGGRYDHYDTFGDALTPRLALVVGLDDLTTLKLLYGKAFRAPNANEFYYEEEGVVRRNPDLGPEEIRTYEVVGERQFSRNLRGSVSGFSNRATNLIDMLEDEDGLLYYANMADDVEAKGVEFVVDGQVGGGARLGASFTYTETEDKATGAPLDLVPVRLAKFSATVPGLPGRTQAGIEVQHVSDRLNALSRGYDAHWLVNATLVSQRLGEGVDVSLSAYNLFQGRYSNPRVGDLEARQDGRLLRLKVGLRF
jgi:iron complex outermembrane receptor protein